MSLLLSSDDNKIRKIWAENNNKTFNFQFGFGSTTTQCLEAP